jgi:ribosomal protein S20
MHSLTARVIAVVVGALALAGGGIAAAAAASSSTGTPVAKASPVTSASSAQRYCQKFLAHLSQDLNTSQPSVESAISKAASQTIDDAVSAGQLTAKQGAQLKSRLSQNALCSQFNGLGRRQAVSGVMARAMQAYLGAAAATLGLTPAQLMTDLRQGQSLQQLAGAHTPPLSESQFRAALIQNLTPALDKAVSDKTLTKAQETMVLQRLQTGPLPLWSQGIKRPTPSSTASPTA